MSFIYLIELYKCCNYNNYYIIGYGFRDQHINKVIADSIDKHNLKLIVVSPQRPREFLNNLQENLDDYPFGKTIVKGLLCYYPYDLANLLDGDSFRFIKNV